MVSVVMHLDHIWGFLNIDINKKNFLINSDRASSVPVCKDRI